MILFRGETKTIFKQSVDFETNFWKLLKYGAFPVSPTAK